MLARIFFCLVQMLAKVRVQPLEEGLYWGDVRLYAGLVGLYAGLAGLYVGLVGLYAGLVGLYAGLVGLYAGLVGGGLYAGSPTIQSSPESSEEASSIGAYFTHVSAWWCAPPAPNMPGCHGALQCQQNWCRHSALTLAQVMWQQPQFFSIATPQFGHGLVSRSIQASSAAASLSAVCASNCSQLMPSWYGSWCVKHVLALHAEQCMMGMSSPPSWI